MTKSNLLKNPVLKNKMNSKVSNPAGDIAQEIEEQDLDGQAGGMVSPNTISTITLPISKHTISKNATIFYNCGPMISVVQNNK